MKKIFSTVLLLSALLSTSVYSMTTVYFDFNGDGLMDSDLLFTSGSSFTVDVYVSGIDNTHGGLISWGTELSFDNTFLTSSSYTIDSLWPLPGVDNNIDNASGTVELLAATFLGGQTGTLKLASITFDAMFEGSTILSIGELFPGNSTFTGFAGMDGHDYDAELTYFSSDITITAVPLPGAIFLFVSGLLGIAGFNLRS